MYTLGDNDGRGGFRGGGGGGRGGGGRSGGGGASRGPDLSGLKSCVSNIVLADVTQGFQFYLVSSKQARSNIAFPASTIPNLTQLLSCPAARNLHLSSA
jgi:hypothetical protein